MKKAALFVSLVVLASGSLSIPNVAFAKKNTVWCVVNDKTGDYTSDCHKEKSACKKAASAEAKKKGGRYSCGANMG
jgi:ABC-type sugar transport system substrate-binding protein